MIRKIIAFFFLACLVIALSIKLVDDSVTRVELGQAFMSFLKSCNIELNDFKIEIPTIPAIPKFSNLNVGIFEGILNAFVAFVNGLSTMINFIITFLNVIIQLLQFIFIIIKNTITLRDTLLSQ